MSPVTVKFFQLCGIYDREKTSPHNPIYEPMPGFYGKEKLPEPENVSTNGTNLTME